MTAYRTWDQLSEVEKLQSVYSDAHKDAYGFRPRNTAPENWTSAVWLREAIGRCEEAIHSNALAAEADEARAIELFEGTVQTAIEAGAADRETAIKWLMQAAENDDPDFFCFQYGLPCGYIPVDILKENAQ